jgi:hypothetical protein
VKQCKQFISFNLVTVTKPSLPGNDHWRAFPVFPHGFHKAGLTHGVITLASPGKVGGGGRDAFIRQRAWILLHEKHANVQQIAA